jgi:perosamine synthetase
LSIPVCIPSIPKNALRYLAAVVNENWISSQCLNPEVDYLSKLEKGFSSYVGARHGIAVNSGTSALHLAVAALDIGPGDEVIVPAFTMISTALSVIHNGATPVFVDADPDTWCMDPGLIEAAITDKTRAIIPVHIYGYPADMDAIKALAAKYALYVIEDAAEAIGTVYKGQMAGSMSDMSCFSFFANKQLTCGEGGMLLTNDDRLAERASNLKNMAFGQPRFIHQDLGFNFRMNNLSAAYAYASFEELDQAIEARIENARMYSEALASISGITLPPVSGKGSRNAYWMYGIRVNEQIFGRAKSETRDLLKSIHSIETRDFFYPMNKQPAILKKGYQTCQHPFPIAEKLWKDGLYLPSSTHLSPDDIAKVCDALFDLQK